MFDAVDQADGKLDGMWRDNSIAQLLQGFDTPARTPYQERVIETVDPARGLRQGRRARPALPELQGDRLHQPRLVDELARDGRRRRAQDLALKRFVAFLNKQVGKGNWVLALTADHGAMPDPAVSGGYQISTAPIQAGINAKFDTNGDNTPVVELVQPSQVFLNTDELTKNGFTVGGRRALHHDAHPAADGRTGPDGQSRDRERQGVPGGVPLGTDAGPPVPAGGAALEQ